MFFLVFTNINLIIRLPSLVGKDSEWLHLKTEKILSTILSPVVKFFYAYRVNYVIVKHFASFNPVWSFFNAQKGYRTLPCVCVCKGVGWFGAGGIWDGVEACQQMWLYRGLGGGGQAKNIGCKRGSLNKFLHWLRSLLHHTIHFRAIIFKKKTWSSPP